MAGIVSSEIGMIHLVSSGFAFLSGTFILVAKKGTKQHIKVGYLYVVSMAVLIATAFMIYRLFDSVVGECFITLL